MDICGVHILQHLSDGGSFSKTKLAYSGYQRLSNETLHDEQDDASSEEEELLFYNDDGSYQLIVVERDLRTGDLCQLLALKNRVAKDISWSIVERWDEIGLERIVEDHEEVIAVYNSTEILGNNTTKRFIFRKDFCKYEFFQSPQQFFPPDLLDSSVLEELLEHHTSQVLVTSAGECSVIGSHLWVRETNKQVWSKMFLVLRGSTLYTSHKAEDMNIQVLAHLSTLNVYSALNPQKQFHAPTEFVICLAGKQETLLCLAYESERIRVCWLTALRLTKYGKQLQENYQSLKHKLQLDNNITCSVPSESVRSRVAMDFTGTVGRIVDDPQEAKAIAVAEGYSWRRRWRKSSHALKISAGLKGGIHITQPWFHSGMTRDQATQLINRHGTVDGVFLVRESCSNTGSFVLTFRCSGKVLHSQIQPVLDSLRESICYSLDGGATKFYDLLQLVEFYQLNTGCLPTRLTHYIVQNPTVSIDTHK